MPKRRNSITTYRPYVFGCTPPPTTQKKSRWYVVYVRREMKSLVWHLTCPLIVACIEFLFRKSVSFVKTLCSSVCSYSRPCQRSLQVLADCVGRFSNIVHLEETVGGSKRDGLVGWSAETEISRKVLKKNKNIKTV